MTIRTRVSVLDHRTLFGTTVNVSADPETSIEDLDVELRNIAPVDGELFFESTPLRNFATVADLDLHDGAVFSVGGPVAALREQDAHQGVDVLVAGGPDAGRVIALPYGRHEIGRDNFRAVALDDPEVSRNHAQLDVTSTGAVLTDLGSANGTLVNGHTITEPVALDGGEYIRVGNSVLVVTAPEAADTALVRGHDGTLTYNRRFRSAAADHEWNIEFPGQYEEEPPPAISFLYLAIPLITGVVMAMILGPRYLIFAFLGPVTGVAGMVASRRQHKTRQARRRAKYDAKIDRSTERHRAAMVTELHNRRDASPDLATLARAARGPRRKLWERRPSDRDFLDLRIGLANRPSAITTSGDTAPIESILPDVPVTVSLVEAGSIGVAGDPDLSIGIARSFLFQIATLQSPSDVRLIVISTDSAWGWTRWLPHVRHGDGDQLLIAGDLPSARMQLEVLEALLDDRRSSGGVMGGGPVTLPRFVVLFDHASRLERHRVARILAEGPSMGVHAICIEDTEPELPEEYAGATVVRRDDRLFVRVRNKPTVSDVSEEIINATQADLAARCLAPLRPESTSTANLPSSCRLLDTIGMPTPTVEEMRERWKTSEGRCRATVGVATSGPLTIELDDRSPHGLVAGMSGAGKSEFLKTLLAEMAIQNHPDDLQFLLVDFKGGGDYRTLARLPHTIDLVTNIDDPEHAAVKRAIALLEAEVDRRQREVNNYGARDLATYKKVREADPSIPIIGRILVVADEFGELASQQPELLDKLVSVARIGRAMGVHLLLATQRPSGSITGQIQANVPLRVCFRVNRGEAADVINSDEPERIARTLAGRGFVRNGDEPPIEFQCARVANARPAVAAIVDPLTVEVEPWSTIGYPRKDKVEKHVEVADPDTDLWDVVEATIGAAESLGWETNPVPWPRPLPDSLRFSPNRAVVTDHNGIPAANVGLRDDPREQRHIPYSIALGRGNMAIAGSPGSGRTTALRTITAGLAYLASPADLHLYALDFAGGGLRALRPIPHLGTITDDFALATTLIEKLEEELEDRRARFAMGGWASLAEQWQAAGPGERIPAIVLIIDGWHSLAEMSGTTRGTPLTDRITNLLSNGSSVGIQAVVAGDRTVALGAISRQMTHRVALRFNDPMDYQALDIDFRSIPSDHRPGRALLSTGQRSVDHVQIAHVGKDPSGPTQNSALRTIGAHLSSVPVHVPHPPIRLAPLPMIVRLPDLLDTPDVPVTEPGSIPVCVGVGGDAATPVWFDLTTVTPGVAIAGPSGSGRSSALVTFARCAINAGATVVGAINGPSRLSEIEGAAGVIGVRRWSEWTIEDLKPIIDAHGPNGSGAADGSHSPGIVVLVDDADRLDARDEVMGWLVDQHPSGVRVIAAGATSSWTQVMVGWLAALRRANHSLLITPSGGFDGNAVGLNGSLPSELQFTRPLGRALWIVNDRPLIVQIPLS